MIFKKLPITVNRQKVIENYIVDFYIAEAKIVIEIDGSQHGKPENRKKDKEKDEALMKMGLTVLRYTNHNINCNFEDVCRDILKRIKMF